MIRFNLSLMNGYRTKLHGLNNKKEMRNTNNIFLQDPKIHNRVSIIHSFINFKTKSIYSSVAHQL